MTEEEYLEAINLCWMMWGLADPDPVEVFHAFRVLRIRKQQPDPIFDDVLVAIKAYKESK